MEILKKGRERICSKLMIRLAIIGLFCVAIIFSYNYSFAQKFNIDDALDISPSASPSSPAVRFGPGGPHIESTNIDISGTIYTAESKATNIGAGVNVSLSVNGGVKSTVATGAGGTFTFSTISVNAGEPFIIFIDNADTNHGNLVSRAKESNISGLDMYTDHIVLRHEDAGPITNANLATADNADAEIKYSVDVSNHVSFDTGYKVWVESAMTYTLGANITTAEDIEVRTTGILNSASNNITLTGNWKISATGTLTITGGTVTFNPSAGTKNIDTGGTDSNHDFSSVTKSGAGTVKLYDGSAVSTSFGMKASGTLTISDGTFNANGRDLNIGVYSQTGGTFDADANNSGNNQNTITCLGNFTINAALTYNSRQSNLILDATAGNITFTGAGYTYSDITFQNNSNTNARTITPTTGTYTLNGSLFGEAQYTQNVTLAANTNNPTFVITGGIIYQGEGAGTESISMGTGSWTVQSGNIYLTDGTITAGSSTLTSNAAGWQELGDGTDSNIYSMTSWSNGGTDYLVIGGSFKEVGSGTRARRIAAWDGANWAEVGGGANGAVRALSVWSNGGTDYLAVAGGFTTLNDGATNANRIALWDGANWTALGTGLNGIARALNTSFSANLIVGGSFTTAGGGAANYIAQWDGANWTTFGTGTSGRVSALTTWTYSATTYLVAGGEFTTAGGVTVNNIAKWNGAAWSAFANGMDGVTYHSVYALCVYSGNLIAGGDFSQVNGDTTIRRVAQWSGLAWSAVGSGFNGTVQALLVDSGGDLYAGGWYRGSGSTPMKRIAKWNSGGSTWELLGETGANKTVYSLAEWTYDSVDYIVMGGAFYKVDGQMMRKIAQWNGSSWSTVGEGIEDPVRALTTYGGNLYLGGSFSDAGGVDADGIAYWNGSSYSAVSGGVNGSVYAMVAYSSGGTDYLAVGGNFTTAGVTTVNRVALWDGANWSACGTGMNNTVFALTVWGGNLIAGGTFTTAGGGAVDRLASWNGAAWSEVGGGVDDNSVRSLAVLGSNLEVGGNFTAVNGGTAMARIGEWTGAAWNALGTGVDTTGYVYALAVSGTDLYAGGSFTGMGGVANTKYIAKWDGAAWNAVGTGMDGGYVYSLSIFDSKLEAGGDFTTAGGVVARRAAEYSGGAWSPLGGGMDDNVYAFATYNSELYAGGLFNVASGTLINRIAKWGTQKITTASQSFNNVTFSAASTSNRKSMISGAFTIVGNLDISESSSGILTLDLDTYDPAMTLTGTFAMGSGTAFLGGSSAITTGNTVSINGGTFTSTSNTFTVVNNFTRAAGATFTHNSGTFLFIVNNTLTVTANNASFNHININRTAGVGVLYFYLDGSAAGNITAEGNVTVENNGAGQLSIGSTLSANPTFTINGNLNFPATASGNFLYWGITTAAGNFTTVLKGNLTMNDAQAGFVTHMTLNSTTQDQTVTITLANTISTGLWTIDKTGFTLILATNLTLANNSFTLSAGTVNIQTFTLSIGLHYTQTNGIFNGASGAMTLNNTGSDFALSVGTYNSPANLTVPDDFTLTSGIFVAPTGTLNISGDFLRQVAATYTHSSGTIQFNGNAAYNITCNSVSFNNVKFDKSAATARILTLIDGFTVEGNLQVQNSANAPNTLTIQANSGVPTITVNGNVTFPSTATSGLIYWGSSTAGNNFTTVIKGNFTISDNPTVYTHITLNSTTANQGVTTGSATFGYGNWIINDPGFTVTLTGNLTNSTGTGDFTLTAGGFNMQDNSINFGGDYLQSNGTLTQGTGTMTFGLTFTVNNGTFSGGSGDITTGAHQTVAINAGNFTSTSGIFKLFGAFTRAGGATFNHHSGTFKFYNWGASSYNITTNNCTFNNVIFGKDTGSNVTVAILQDSFSVAGNITFQNEGTSNTYTVRSTGSILPTIAVSGSLSFPTTAAAAAMTVGSTTATENFSINVGGNLTTNDANANLYTNIRMNGTSADQSIATTTYGVISDGNWVIDDAGYTVTLNSNLTPSGASTPNFTLTAGGFNMQNYNFSFAGNFLMTTGTFTHGNGSITIGGDLTMNNGNFYGGAGTISVGNYKTVAINNGIFRSTSGNFTMRGSFTKAAPATFTHNSGTITFDEIGTGAVYYITTNNASFNNVVFTKDDILFNSEAELEDSFTVEGNLTFKAENANNLQIRSIGSLNPTITVNGNLEFPSTGSAGDIYAGSSVAAEQFTINLKGNITANDADAYLRAHVQLTNTLANQTITLTSIGGTGYGNWSITKGNYTAIQATTITLNNGSGLAINSGAWYTGGFNLTVPGTFSNDGTFRLQGGEATLSFTRDTNSGTVEYVGDGGATGYGSLLYGDTYWNLNIASTSGSNTWSLNNSLDVNGTTTGVSITSGTLNSNGFDITDVGNWTVTAPGVFTSGVKKVTLDGAAIQTITCGPSSLFDLTSTNASAAGITFSGNCTVTGTLTDTTDNSKLTFGAGSTYTIAAANISATAGNTVTMVSSTPSTHWMFNVSAPTAVTRVAVQDSDATGGSTITDIPGTNNGNNHNWIFAMDISGTVFTNEAKTLNIGAGKDISLSIQGAPKTTQATGAGGTFSFTTVPYMPGNTITLFIDGEAEKGNMISIADDGSVAGLEMVTNRIILRHEDSGPITNAHLVTAKTAGETDILYTLSGSDVTFGNTYEVWIDTGKTYTPGALVTADDFYITGTGVFIPAANAVTLHGSYRSAATATLTASNTFTFDAAAGTETIDSGGTGANHDFLNITKTTGGTIALTGHAIDITGTLTISASTTFNMSSQEMTLNTLDNSNLLMLTGSQTASAITNMDTNSGTVEYTGNAAYTILSIGNNYFNLWINSAGGTGSFSPGVGTVDLNGTFTLDSGTFNLGTNNPALNVAGNVTLNAGTYTKGTAMTTFDGDLSYDDNIGAVNIGRLTIGHSPDITNLAADLVCDSLTIDGGDSLITNGYDIDCGGAIDINGTLNAANGVGGNSQINLTGNWDATGGTFTNTNSTVVFDGAAAQSITMDGEDFNNWETTNASGAGVTFVDATDFAVFTDNTAASKITFHAGSTYNISTTLDVDGAVGPGNVVTLVSSTPTSQWFFNVSQLNPTVTYVDVTDSDANGGNNIDATNNCINGGNNENWDFGQPVINSMTFINPYSGTAHTAVADNTTSWDFRVLVTDTHGSADINYIEIRFANATDSVLPYDSLKLRFTEGAPVMFTETADTQGAATLTSVNGDATAVGDQWTLDFKMQINNNFLNKDMDYNIEVYALDDHALSDDQDYSNAYLVTALYLTFTIDSGSINFGDLTPGTPITATTVCTVSTNAGNGYDLAVHDSVPAGDSALRHTDLITYISDYLGTIAVPTVWAGTGLGVSVYSATGKDAKWGAGSSESDPLNRYAGIPQAATIIHTKTGNPTINDVTRVGYKLDVPNTQKTGIYSGDVTFTSTEKLF